MGMGLRICDLGVKGPTSLRALCQISVGGCCCCCNDLFARMCENSCCWLRSDRSSGEAVGCSGFGGTPGVWRVEAALYIYICDYGWIDVSFTFNTISSVR